MAWLGVLLTTGGCLWAAALWCRAGRRRLALGRELLRQLALLRREILTLRRPLGEAAEAQAARAEESAGFWRALLDALESEEPFSACWDRACRLLPAPYGGQLAPLGAVLALGEREAELLLDQAGEELGLWLRREEGRCRERERLAAVLGFSAGALLSLALL